MKPSLSRLLLTWLLLIVMPLQGFAAVSLAVSERCGMEGMGMLTTTEADKPMAGNAHDIAAPETAHHAHAQPDSLHEGHGHDGDDDTANTHPCSHCTPCCTSMSLGALSSPLTLAMDTGARQADFPPLTQTLPAAPVHTLERPPRH